MALQEHPAYKEEMERLKETLLYVEEAVKAAEHRRGSHKEEIRQAFVDLDHLDSSLSYVTILLHAKLLDELEKNFDGLLRARKKPYFARIDFRELEKGKVEKFYIGKMSLLRPDWEIPMILDWRSPLASVYYDGRLGEVSYETEKETLHGELLLKRQYTIEDAALKDIMDIDITTTDTFLQASLGENRDNRLQEIVSTIQAEQNAIIRAPIDRPLVVQGVAGSGKTTIALHRIAYLIYTYEESFHPEQFMIIAPNRLFLNYISEVLPELGVDKVVQTTYVDCILDLVGLKWKVEDPDAKLLALLEPAAAPEGKKAKELIRKVSAFKGSLAFREVLERYVQDLAPAFVPEAEFTLGGQVLLDTGALRALMLEEYAYLPLYKRVEQVKKYLAFLVKGEKKRILEEVEEDFNNRIDRIRDTEPEGEVRRDKLVALMDERDRTLETVKKEATTAVKKFMGLFPKQDLASYYRELMGDPDVLGFYAGNLLDSDALVHCCRHAGELLDGKRLEVEDLAALAYLRKRIYGFSKDPDIRYVVVDEAQDFSHFQFQILKEVFNTKLFTILGDLSQGIHGHRGIREWSYVLEEIFGKEESQYLTLEQSYRTTIEIMEMANGVIRGADVDGLVLARPVVRHGKAPEDLAFSSPKEVLAAMKDRLLEYREEGFRSIAVIGKTPAECRKIHQALGKEPGWEAILLDSKEDHQGKGIVVLPAYLSKGLEFDAVLIVTLEESYTKEDLDVKLLYVAMTRALHRMDVLRCQAL
ncbi:RNA polymerase recycling motor HelD [Anaerotalea alkaliphila]|uniref:UvrD-helicase domain-containing protein n=1 Tax=Anaerotalea alkaliphila TaxID=2662126 RepID=A0A7X5HUU6_9FIRM|nr:RNA polymerase recycling motor HelD [Anaerotalea alkaliphila]NDL67000.1 UvrD-helicase domain-containing protein [Anaerotalea alkaliphila]